MCEHREALGHLYREASRHVGVSENIRWARLNSLLVTNSLLVAACALVARSDLKANSRLCVITPVCLFGYLGGIVWSVLGVRSSHFHASFVKAARAIEAALLGVAGDAADQAALMPFLQDKHVADRWRGVALSWVSSSTTIVSLVPVLFSIVHLCVLGAFVYEAWPGLWGDHIWLLIASGIVLCCVPLYIWLGVFRREDLRDGEAERPRNVFWDVLFYMLCLASLILAVAAVVAPYIIHVRPNDVSFICLATSIVVLLFAIATRDLFFRRRL